MVFRTSGVSLYHQIKEELRKEVRTLDYGAQIETEEQLPKRYQVSRGPIRQAINDLVAEGILYRVQGKGTFRGGVAVGKSSFVLGSFTEQLIACGLRPGIADITLETVLPTRRVAKNLEIDESCEVFRLMRVRLANEEPISLGTAYLKKELVPDLKQSDLKMSLISMLTDAYGHVIQRRRSYCSACSATELLSEKLHVPAGTPILQIVQTGYLASGEPLFCDIMQTIGEKSIMQIEQYI